MNTPPHLPRQVVLFSGKRKSGKDFVAELVQSRFGSNQCTILRLSEPLKKQYAKEHDLDLTRLLDASSYKENYREDMIRWGEEKRSQDPAYFCDLVVDRAGEGRFPVWIVSDARRKSDVEYFRSRFGELVTSVRVVAREDVRRTRGWEFTAGVDDAESECGLDVDVTFDVVIENNGEHNVLFETSINKLCSDIYNKL